MNGYETRLIRTIILERMPTKNELDTLSENALQSLRDSALHACTDKCSYPSPNDPERIRFQMIHSLTNQALERRRGT